MILADVRSYLKQRGEASLSDLALHFDTDPEALRGMLDVWVRKGKVVHRRNTAACGSTCNQCDVASTELYVWAGSTRVQLTPLPMGCKQ